MIKYTCPKLLILFCLAGAWPLAATAEQIYHWVDADGVNHYSQSPPPAASSEEVRIMDVDGSRPASYDPTEDRYNIAAQNEATQAVYDKLAESRKNKQQATQNTAENTVIYYPEPDANNHYLYPPVYRPRPPHPEPRPPQPRPPNESLLPDLPAVAPAVPSTQFRPGQP